MATPRFAWGIDVGNRALKAVKLVSTAEGLVIDDFDVIEHETVLSASGDNRDGLIQTALATFVSRHPGIEKGQVGVGVTGQQSFARFIKLPPVEDRKIPEIVRFEAIQQIPFPLDEVEWSYQLFRDPESPEVEVGIFAMRKDLVNQHIKFFTDAKLNVQAVQMNPLSVYNAMYYDSRIKGTTMIIDVGAENTDLIIAEGETIWLRSISIGGNNFTESLTKAFKVNFVKAEDLKRNASTSKYGRQIMQAMRPIFADLVSEIQRSIGFYSSVHKESRINKVIAVGSTFRLPGLQKYLSQNLTLDVEKLDRLSSGAIEDPKVAAMFSDNLLSAAGAYGLALQVMGQGKINSSLLPETIRRDKMWAEKTKWFVGAAALFMVGAAIPYGRIYLEGTQFKSEENKTITDQIEHVKLAAGKLDKDWDQIASAGGPEKQRILNVEGMAVNREIWPQINTMIYSTLPQNSEGKQPEVNSTNPEEIKKIHRGDRKQIFITAKVATYYPDIGVAINAGLDPVSKAEQTALATIPGENGSLGGGGMGPGRPHTEGAAFGGADAGAAAAAKPERGFIIAMKISTPNAAGLATIQKFCDDLKALQPTSDRPMEIRQVKIVKQSKIRDDSEMKAALIRDYNDRLKAKAQAANPAQGGPPGVQPEGRPPNMDGGPGFGGPGYPGQGSPAYPGPGGAPYPGQGGGGGTGAVGEKVPDEAYQDPVLKEDLRDDTQCVVVLALVIDPNPAPPSSTKVASAGAPAPGQ